MAEDPTLVQTLLNMMKNGCTMHADIFTTMGKGPPEFVTAGNQLQIAVSDGVYTATIAYDAALSTAKELEMERDREVRATS